MKLTQDAVAKLTLPPGKSEHVAWDTSIPGFGARVRPHSATWIFRYRRGRRQPRVTIGAVSAISAARARTIASQLYARVKLGEDPAGDRAEKLARTHETFEFALRPYLLRKQAELRPRSFANVQRHLLSYAAPLHRLPLTKAAERRTLAALLIKVADSSGPVAANSMKGSLSGLFTWAAGQGLVASNPVTVIPNAPVNGPRSHVPTDVECVKIWNALRADDFGDIVRLLFFTLCRRSEIADVAWDEIDFAAGVIRLSSDRTKTGHARDVPLSAPARRILQARDHGNRALVFGTGEGGGFSGWSRAKRDLDARAGVTGWTLHDIRRYGSSVMNAEGIALPHIIEAALGHVVGDRIARTYNWSSYPEQVRVALELWGERIAKLVSGERKPTKILALRRRKGA